MSNILPLPAARKQPSTLPERATDGTLALAEALAVERRRLDRTLFMAGMVVGAIVLFGLIWAILSTVSGAVVAMGSVEVAGAVKVIQHPDGGVIRSIAVKNGDRVKEGDVIAELDVTQTKAQLGVVLADVAELTIRRARLEAEVTGTAPVWPDTTGLPSGATQLATERMLYDANRDALRIQKEQIALRVSQLETQISALRQQIDAQGREAGFAAEENRALEALYEKGLTTLARVTAARRLETQLESQRAGLAADIATNRERISELRQQALALDENRRTAAADELRQVKAAFAAASERRAAAESLLARATITAPATGVVNALAINTIGGVISPANPIARIVPDQDALVIDARVAPGDVDQVAIDQPVRVRFTAFDRTKTPELRGKVSRVAADITIAENGLAGWYVARIVIPPEELARLGQLRLVSGMPVETFIERPERNIMSFLLKPLTDQFERAMREE
jgi:HlyD family secretion protein